jgi:hypothetical protein
LVSRGFLEAGIFLGLPGASHCRSFRMSMKAPPTLLQLAGQSLLKNEALDISALETLPWSRRTGDCISLSWGNTEMGETVDLKHLLEPREY